jgi:transcriptional regulator with XRE-family HTH domain
MTARYDYGTLAERLKQALKDRKIGYAELAERLGMSESGLKKVMSADDISLARLAAICDAAGLDLMTLLEASWSAPPPVFQHTPEQIAFFQANPTYYRFLVALLTCDLDVQRLARDYDLDQPSIVLYLGKLEDLGLVTVHPGGRIKSVIPAPYRTAGPPGVDDDKHAFLDLVLDPRTENRRLFMAALRMTGEHYEALKVAVRDLVVEYGLLARRDELTHADADLVPVQILAAMAPCQLRDYTSIPRLR